MIGLIGKKIGMTQVFDDDGKIIPVTVIEAGPCRVIQRKTKEREGYDAIQLGYGEIKEEKANKARLGHFKKHNSQPFRYIREFRLRVYRDVEEGEEFDASMFIPNELVKITGISKGRGFAGGMKRHNFSGFEATHGVHESFRGSGSIGQCATPSRVMKGKKMAGHMGLDRVTVNNIKIVQVDTENNLLLVKGAVPGHRNSLVLLSKEL